jgi:subtilisin-like proprotein convertase family protein
MRLKTRTWVLISLGCFVAAVLFWRLGDQRMAQRKSADTNPVPLLQTNAAQPTAQQEIVAPVISPANLVVTAEAAAEAAPKQGEESEFAYRLSNTSASVDELAKNDKALLLRNALIDTAAGKSIAIPEALRSKNDPGSYVVQARGVLSDGFRRELQAVNARIISYVPNNAYLVRVSADGARKLADMPQTQSVLPYEPYFKLDLAVLPHATGEKPLLVGTKLRVTVFPEQRDAAVDAMQRAGARVIAEDRSPFGPELIVEPAPNADLASLAQLAEVQNVEFAYDRMAANDLTRVRVQVSQDSVVPTNYVGLSGTNIYISINDTGVDAGHPDLTNRVVLGPFTTDQDPNGHGTHVAGVIASTGANGPVPSTNVVGSVDGASFRGMAHGATLFSMNVFNDILADYEIQETIASTNLFLFGKTNALISNNSWGYRGAFTYNSPAASYDAAVRDSIPGLTGSQPVLFVFAAGNSGSGNDNGSGGFADTVTAPGTAKNVITVGAIETPRNITNLVVKTNDGGGVVTNAVFLPSTDSSNQVLRSSSRGNVGIGIEGKHGRFKPDVVAPGSFIVSTRCTHWDTNSYYHPTNVSVFWQTNLFIGQGDTNYFSVFIPRNAVALAIEVVQNDDSPAIMPPMILYASTNYEPSLDPAVLRGTNFVYMNMQSFGWTNDIDWFFDVVNTNNATIGYDIRALVYTTNNVGNEYEVLENLNNALGGTNPPPKYRYESGTSLAAPAISGMLGLLQEYFETKVTPAITNVSPALMKAMLINSARSVGPAYNLKVNNTINYQGWGLPSILRMLPTADVASSPIMYFDQDITNALATGEEHKREFNISTAAQGSPLRVTLVWTDPPGNPAVGVKLVNDLDLVVTNLDNGNVYFGNHFPGGSDFSDINIIGNTNGSIVLNNERDVVNNVENVYVNGPLGSRYAVSVVARRVNVNAVTAQTNGIKQDYALVISSGNLLLTNTFTVTNEVISFDPSPFLISMTNMDAGDVGERVSFAFMEGERVGANYPLELGTNGTLQQWNFYRFTNKFGFSNVAFATFATADLSGVATRRHPVPTLRNVDADLDLYVSTNIDLLTLDAVVIDQDAFKSVGRNGDELIIRTDAPAISNHVYYIGVKSEDQRAGEFSIYAIASEAPFADVDGENVRPRFFPRPSIIPDGSPTAPGQTQVIGFVPPIGNGKIRRMVVTNILDHQDFGDLVGVIHKQGESKYAILNNHTFPLPDTDPDVAGGTNIMNVYNDTDEGDTPGSIPSDGPGLLSRFMGEEAGGMWFYTVSDSAISHTGRVVNFFFHIERQPEPESTSETEVLFGTICKPIFGGSQRYDALEVPPGTTNLIITADTPGIEIYVRRGELPTLTDYDKTGTGLLTLGLTDVPPLIPDTYYIMLYNPGATADVCWTKRIQLMPADTFLTYRSGGINLLDDAVTNSSIFVTNNGIVSHVQVGVRVDHPRVSDLSMRLISPKGTRVLLFENRGGLTPFGIGTNVARFTNIVGIWTNNFNSMPFDYYDAPSIVDDFNVTTNNVRVVHKNEFNLLSQKATAYDGNTFVAMNYGTMSQVLPTTNGGGYRLSFAYRRAPVLDPVSWWKAEANEEDSMPNLNHGSIVGSGVTYAAGQVGQAFSFDGTGNSGVLIPADPSLNVTDFTIEGWIYCNDVSSPRPIIEWADPTGNAGVHIWYGLTDTGNPSGRLYANVRSTGGLNKLVITPPNTLNANEWTHIALTFESNSGSRRIYVNGSQVGPTVSAGGGYTPATDLPIYLGLRPSGSSETLSKGTNHLGMLDEFAIYNTVLDLNDIKEIYDSGLKGFGKCGALNAPSVCGGTIAVNIDGVSTNLVPTTEWQTYTNDFVATSDGTTLELQGLNLNGWVDTFLLEEGQPEDGIYGIFTEDLRFSPELIKFAQPPFGALGFTNGNIITNSFELPIATNYLVGDFVEDWEVINTNVSVVTETNLAASGTNVLSLNSVYGTNDIDFGTILTNVTTVPGNKYTIRFAYRAPYSSLINWWPGDSSELDVIGGEDAVLNGMFYSPGVVNDSFVFDGFSGYLNSGGAAGNFSTNDFTIDFWVQTDSLNNSYLMSKREACDQLENSWDLRLNAGTLELVVRDGATPAPNIYTVTGPVVSDPALVPHHVAVTRRGGDIMFFLDGQLVSTTPVPVVDLNNSGPMLFGVGICFDTDIDGFGYFGGNLDEIGFHSGAISGAEIKSLFEAGALGRNDSSNPPITAPMPQIRLTVNNVPTLVDGAHVWRIFRHTFVATNNSTPITIETVTNGMWIDSVAMDESSQSHYLPEESLGLLSGENAYGLWTLEVWDNRLGEAIGANLVSWQLDINYIALTNFTSGSGPSQPSSGNPNSVFGLANASPMSSSVAPGSIRYFTVQVPPSTTAATNSLVSHSGAPLDLLFNQNALPMQGPDNFFLLRNVTNGLRVLTNNSLPELVPGQRYYLGVRNNGTETNEFTLNVSYDFSELVIDVPLLANAVPVSTNIPSGFAMQHFKVAVPDNATSATFEILDPDGNVDLYVKSGAPLPTYNNYTYKSDNEGTGDELIEVTPASEPTPLAGGTWYLGVLNLAGADVAYTIKATVVTPGGQVNIYTLTPNVPVQTMTPPTVELTNFYRLVITQANPSALFELYNLSGNVDLLVRRGALPSLTSFDLRSDNSGLTGEQVVISSSQFGNLNGEWFVAVPNNETFAVDYTIRASLSTNGLLLSAHPLQVLPSREPPASVKLTWNSVATENYQVLVSTNFVNWDVVDTVTATSEITIYTDPSTNGVPQFYRVKQVP